MIRSASGMPSHNSASWLSADSSSRAARWPRIPVSSSVASGNERGPRTSRRTPSRPASSRLARDQRPARAVSRQQRAHLLLRPGIVQDDQRLPVPQQRPVHRSTLRDILRDLLIRQTERAKQQPQRVGGGRRPRGHAEQVKEEHPAGEVRPQDVGRPDGERGLPHAPRAGDEPDHAGTRCTLGVYQLAHPDQFRGTAGEVVNQPGQFTQAGRARPVIPQPAITR